MSQYLNSFQDAPKKQPCWENKKGTLKIASQLSLWLHFWLHFTHVFEISTITFDYSAMKERSWRWYWVGIYGCLGFQNPELGVCSAECRGGYRGCHSAEMGRPHNFSFLTLFMMHARAEHQPSVGAWYFTTGLTRTSPVLSVPRIMGSNHNPWQQICVR